VTNYDHYTDDYEDYEIQFDPMRTDRKARRKRKPKVKHTPKKAEYQIIAEIADANSIEGGGFETTYTPGPFEEEWLLSSLRAFFDQDLISDVLGIIKGGKEASVYRCAATLRTGVSLVAAKVYRPRKFRNLRNDKMYREGRQILTASGKPVRETDDRLMRAIGKKSAFGVQVEHTSWLMYEYTTLQTLYQAGASVPQPFAASDNAILMGYIGDTTIAAPTLNTVALEVDEVEPLFNEVLRNVELMLQHNLIHGDLSAFNILYWAGDMTLIDFPQVTNCRSNSNARTILQRDITRICEYFASQGLRCNAEVIANDLWQRYAEPRPNDLAADLSRMEAEEM
jgi:RIO kinase 1